MWQKKLLKGAVVRNAHLLARSELHLCRKRLSIHLSIYLGCALSAHGCQFQGILPLSFDVFIRLSIGICHPISQHGCTWQNRTPEEHLQYFVPHKYLQDESSVLILRLMSAVWSVLCLDRVTGLDLAHEPQVAVDTRRDICSLKCLWGPNKMLRGLPSWHWYLGNTGPSQGTVGT